MISVPKANITEIQERNMKIAQLKEERAKKEKLKSLEQAETQAKEEKRQ